MKKNKHKTPSRERYEKNNPVWSVRMPKEWIDKLEAELEFNGQSRRDFLGVALKKQTFNDEEIRATWYKKGYSQGHERGNEKDSHELVKEITGEDVSSEYLIVYLKEKYSSLYN